MSTSTTEQPFFIPFDPADWAGVEFGEACSIEEYAFLYGIAAMLRPNRILEIGSSTGLGTCALIAGACICGDQLKITTIDQKKWPIEANIEKILGRPFDIDARTGDSADILEELVSEEAFFDLCFIDGGHDFQTVSNDWSLARKLSEFFLIHDTSSEKGVSKLICEIKKDPDYSVLSFDYEPGHKLDEFSQEWYRILVSPGMTLVKKGNDHA